MRLLSGKVRRVVISAAFLVGSGLFTARAFAQGGPDSHQVILPNPTPRPADPHDVFRDDSALRAREQQAIALKRAKMHAQMVIDTKDILVLAQQIRDHRINHDAGGTATGSDLVSAQQIEKLAKQVKENANIQ